ncbi:hypothetical protein K5549_021920 [Capra hircus]|nr:hypothetical protein K5549_021920 [Capra hircus]
MRQVRRALQWRSGQQGDFGEGGRGQEAWWPRRRDCTCARRAGRAGVLGVSPARAGPSPARAERRGPAGVAGTLGSVVQAWARAAARARPVLLQRELCARPGARTAPPAPSCRRRRRWARPPGRGSGPRRQLLPASRTSSPPRSRSGPESRPRVPVESSPSPPSPSRHPPRPAARSRPPQSPRRPCASPAMLSFQYPDVYRDETAVSTQLRLAHSPPPAAPHPLRPLSPCSPLPLGLCLYRIIMGIKSVTLTLGLKTQTASRRRYAPESVLWTRSDQLPRCVYFYFYNTGLQNQRVLYVQDSLEGEARVFLDPNILSDDGTVALRGYAFSEDGEYFAYGLSASGSDWVTIKFMKVDGAKELPDVLERVKFSCMAWTHDGKGMFYNAYPQQDGKSDGRKDPIACTLLVQAVSIIFFMLLLTSMWCKAFSCCLGWSLQLSDDGRYVLLSIREGCDPVNRLWYCDLHQEPNGITGILKWVKLIDNFEGEYDYVTNEGTVFTFKTNRHSPNYRLINIDFTDPEESRWKVLVPEHEKDVLEWVACVRSSFLVLCYLHDVKNTLQLHDLATGALLKTFPLEVGSVVGYSGQKKDTEIFYQFTSFLSPGIIYHCDLTKEELEPRVFREVTVKGIDASDYQTVQIFYPSKDGTKIPMFIVHKKGIKLDGSHPAFLYGYGGFNISITPNYSVSRLIFMRHMGGVLAVANIRGGGEYGETWHKATCANQRPDLFGCVIAQVGVMDMLKFHKYTIGHAWTTDYGCSDNKQHFEWLIKYSPLHNVKLPEADDIQYPSMLLLTADHDDRVVPLHSLKFIATLQHLVGRSRKQNNPLLIHVDTKAGHGAGKPTAKVIEEVSDMFAFIARCLNIDWIQ